MEKDFYSQFKNMSEGARLSQKEKDFHRGEILRFMEKQPSPYVDKKLSSPFYIGIFLKRHFIVASLVIILFSSGGITISAESSLPNDYLYQIKTKITEPVLVFLTSDKAKIKVALVERRFQEFSQVTLNEEINLEDKTAFVSQLSLQVGGAHKEIKKLVQSKNTGKAIKATNDLQSILSAQNTVLEKIHIANPEAESTDDIENFIEDSIERTTEIEGDLTETVNSKDDQSNSDEITSDQKEEISVSLEDIKNITESVPEGDTPNFDSEDQSYINSKLSDINEVLKRGDEKLLEGEKNDAFILYNQADQKLGELKSLIDSDRELGIDVLGETNNTDFINKSDSTTQN